MKVSSATSATATEPPPPADPSSARQPSLTTAEFSLSGPSEHPDPSTHAYRKDLADLALAGRVIASHYAEPLPRSVATGAELRSAPEETSEILRQLNAGEPFEILENSLGWAWGYAGSERIVGYVRSEALAPPA
ncbi:MAG TPA: SH3 domain-containing protein [Sphingomicrobium sp.]|nr:SH3 domain-containing protein [Sphingomicrobium sp.]